MNLFRQTFLVSPLIENRSLFAVLALVVIVLVLTFAALHMAFGQSVPELLLGR